MKAKITKGLPVAFGVFLWGGFPLYGWVNYGWRGLEKCLTAFAMPIGFVWSVALLFLLVGMYRGHRDLVRQFLLLSVLIWFAGNHRIAGWLHVWLEKPIRVHELRLEQHPSYDAVVLLGGSTWCAEGKDPELNWDGQRLLLAAQLFHAGKTDQIIATGGDPVTGGAAPSHAEQARQLLVSAAVPRANIICLGGSNTGEEIKALRDHFPDGISDRSIGMITNASHLARAMGLAQEENLEFLPIPCCFAGGSGTFSYLELIPSSNGVSSMTGAVYEILARLAGH